MSADFDGALRKALTGGQPVTWSRLPTPGSLAGQLALLLGEAGRAGVSGIARALGVPRRTVRRWMAGENTPRGERADQVREAAGRVVDRQNEARRTAAVSAAIGPGREQRIRSGAVKMKIRALMILDTPGKPNPRTGVRVKDVGAHIPRAVINRILDAQLNGQVVQAMMRKAIDDYYCDSRLFVEIREIWFE